MNLYDLNMQEIVERISRHCPECLCVYIQCVNRANANGSVFFSKYTVEVDMSYSWTKFRNSLKKLALENLLEWHPFDRGVSVTLAVSDEDE